MPRAVAMIFLAVASASAWASSNKSPSVWWEDSTEEYVFKTDLTKSKGGKFIKDAMRLMAAMRKSYESYIPPEKKIGRCTVKVFKTLDSYRADRRSTGENDEMSSGLWDPNREELLISAEDKEQAQRTMRHEAFHQYLHYATGRGDHAIWFNEGHACLFEEVRYDAAKNTVKLIENHVRSKWVEKCPEQIAARLRPILLMSQGEYYSGDVNLNYVSGWALVYFLERGSYACDDFKVYRDVVPRYLAAMKRGEDPNKATAYAFAAVASAERDMEKDFMRFWTKYRKLAANAREKTKSKEQNEIKEAKK